MGEPAYEVRTIDRLLAVLNQGDDNAEATRQYRQIMDRLANNIHEYGGKFKAELTLTVSFEADAKGIDVSVSVKSKIPAIPKIKERFFQAGDGTNVLSLQDPARETLFAGVDLGRRGGPRDAGAAS